MSGGGEEGSGGSGGEEARLEAELGLGPDEDLAAVAEREVTPA